eukprot:7069777-Alexandrium_andersonii.AAC.1
MLSGRTGTRRPALALLAPGVRFRLPEPPPERVELEAVAAMEAVRPDTGRLLRRRRASESDSPLSESTIIFT